VVNWIVVPLQPSSPPAPPSQPGDPSSIVVDLQPSGTPPTPVPDGTTGVVIHYPQGVLDKLQTALDNQQTALGNQHTALDKLQTAVDNAVDKLSPHHSLYDWLYSSAGATVCAAIVAGFAIFMTRKSTREQINALRSTTKDQIDAMRSSAKDEIAEDRRTDFLKARREALVAADEARQEQYEAIRNLVDSRKRTGDSPAPDLLAYNAAETASRRAQYKLKLFGYDDETVVTAYGNLRKAARALRDNGIASMDTPEFAAYRRDADTMNDALAWLTKHLELDVLDHKSGAATKSNVGR
jgi:hypothetical protein